MRERTKPTTSRKGLISFVWTHSSTNLARLDLHVPETKLPAGIHIVLITVTEPHKSHPCSCYTGWNVCTWMYVPGQKDCWRQYLWDFLARHSCHYHHYQFCVSWYRQHQSLLFHSQCCLLTEADVYDLWLGNFSWLCMHQAPPSFWLAGSFLPEFSLIISVSIKSNVCNCHCRFWWTPSQSNKFIILLCIHFLSKSIHACCLCQWDSVTLHVHTAV